MQLNVKALALALAIVWAAAVLLTGLLNLVNGYGQAFLDVVSSVYPGYRATPSLGQVAIGTLYALLDGAIAGAVFAWVYNRCAGARTAF